ncbi:M48 family metallopeptidase [Hahella sp. HN01]|uniref:M48 family metallopeptidase n=1 Tax=Hahella sp. HN01 TaxID=2847262 RepID=UPI001C1EA3AE|nr:M48 family metallopeptidase [Hahella sp. HN01]MBU6954861.1 M48 family metallopeptidase [Hahella sp. HN01]
MEPTQTYQAHAFHEQFNNGRASGSLTVSSGFVEFSNGESSVRFPVTGAQVKMGGASDRLVFITHPDFPEWSLYTSDRSILHHPALHQDNHLQGQLRKARNVRRINWSVLVIVVALIIGTPLSIVVFMDSITAVAAKQVPAEWEEKLGKTVFGQYQVENELLESEDGKQAVAALTDPLINAVKDERYTYKVYVSNSSDINAFALPGGYIVINSGLILAADNASEVLGVMAHEISHVTEQHGVRNIMGAAGTYALAQALFGDVSGLLATVANAAPLLLNQSYSRGFESDADAKGLELLKRANIDPKGLISFFDKIIEEEKKRLEKIEDEDARDLMKDTMGFLSSHPATEDRIADLQERISDQEGDYRNLEPEFQRLKQLVKEFVAEK